MSLRDWWEAVKDLFKEPPTEEEPKKRFVPPHSLPDSELPPQWPPKEERE
jgi:hypothetical protein